MSRKKKFTFAISSPDEFLFGCNSSHTRSSDEAWDSKRPREN